MFKHYETDKNITEIKYSHYCMTRVYFQIYHWLKPRYYI